MMLPGGEFKLFEKPDYAAGRPGDAAWYKDRAVSDHINEPGHKQRLLQALDLVIEICAIYDIETISDLGAGNGGLLSHMQHIGPKCWGYDMSPLAVKDGIERYKVDLRLLDIIELFDFEVGEIVVMTEYLEHLVRPHDLVNCLFLRKNTKFIVASVPGFEDVKKPYEFHLWSWHGTAFADMFTRIGWKVERHFFRADCSTQFLVARR